jgi:hypothetical protein
VNDWSYQRSSTRQPDDEHHSATDAQPHLGGQRQIGLELADAPSENSGLACYAAKVIAQGYPDVLVVRNEWNLLPDSADPVTRPQTRPAILNCLDSPKAGSEVSIQA